MRLTGKGCRAAPLFLRSIVIPFALSLICFQTVRVGHAETFDQLKGLSIEVTYQMHTTYRTPQGTLSLPRLQPASLRVYISSKGNIFEAEKLGVSGLVFKFDRITALDRATESRLGLLQTWTMTAGHLTRITQYKEGFRVITIYFSRSRATGMCFWHERRTGPQDRKSCRVFTGGQHTI
jgi:hypothetical protein